MVKLNWGFYLIVNLLPIFHGKIDFSPYSKTFLFRALPISAGNWLTSAVNAITKKYMLDIIDFDLTREQGQYQPREDLFSALESIKNDCVIDVMYGKFNNNKAVFDLPIVFICSNINFSNIKNYLSYYIWVVCQPPSGGLIVSDKGSIHPGAITPINFKLLKDSSYKTTK